jgi:hypothetical protein
MRILIYLMLVVFASGCKWNDDFRQRQQPQYKVATAEPTFNKDSDYYVGDSVARPTEYESNQSNKVYLPDIDELEPIPEIQDSSITYD